MTISFTGPLGGNREISTRLKASTFPLLEDYVNQIFGMRKLR